MRKLVVDCSKIVVQIFGQSALEDFTELTKRQLEDIQKTEELAPAVRSSYSNASPQAEKPKKKWKLLENPKLMLKQEN